jgi:hypothetical protein
MPIKKNKTAVSTIDGRILKKAVERLRDVSDSVLFSCTEEDMNETEYRLCFLETEIKNVNSAVNMFRNRGAR